VFICVVILMNIDYQPKTEHETIKINISSQFALLTFFCIQQTNHLVIRFPLQFRVSSLPHCTIFSKLDFHLKLKTKTKQRKILENVDTKRKRMEILLE